MLDKILSFFSKVISQIVSAGGWFAAGRFSERSKANAKILKLLKKKAEAAHRVTTDKYYRDRLRLKNRR